MEVNVVLVPQIAELADEPDYLDSLLTEAEHYLGPLLFELLEIFDFIGYLLEMLQGIISCIYLVVQLLLELCEIVDVAVIVFELVDQVFLLSDAL